MFAQQCKQMNISINAVFRKDRLNNQNAAPVHLRLTQNRKLKHISTGVTLNINEWDFENQRVKGQTPELQALQLRIDTKIDELRRKIKRLEALEVEVTLDNLLETNGLKINCTVGEYLKQTIDIQKLITLEIVPNYRTNYAEFARDIFLFSYYTAGINFTDMATLRYCDIVDGRIYYSRHKTQKLLSFQLVPNAMQIIEKYSKANHAQEDYIFPILNRSKHKTARQIFNRTHKALRKVNRELKTLGEQIGVEMPLTTYVARHAFATVLKGQE